MIELFPFLIGKVLTYILSFYLKLKVVFPFLIGKVLTVWSLVVLPSRQVIWFPFLIGKVLTIDFSFISLPKNVSIPYR